MTSVASNPKEALLNDVRGEFDRMQLRIKELQTLIDQSQVEVKRLQQRSVDINTQLNRLEANFDTVPRNDIKTIYTNALDTKTRLLTMQSQLEKVQQDRTQLEGFTQTLQRLMLTLEGVPVGSVVGAPVAATGSKPLNSPPVVSNSTIVRVVEAQEAERKKLARQMHDGPAQSLTNFILQAEICQRLFDRNPDRATEELGNLKTAASTTFQKVRDFIFDLRPMMLDDLGLVPTVRRYVDAFTEKSSIPTQLNIVGEERRRVAPHAEVTMFRAVQEVLAYARDISGASKVDLTLDTTADVLKSTASFDGKDVQETEAAVQQSGDSVFGLEPLRQRVELLSGSVQIFGGADGNTVEIVIPAGQPN
ncbi:MAG TPA: histidine kinase [Aggregatilineales bacterium]|nr:histidine kinase [Aggregatilineales bacterium]